MKFIELCDVQFHQGPTTILQRCSLAIELGQHTVILGPNGSGKSTLLKLLMRFFYPSLELGQSGSVRVFEQDHWNVWELRQRLGYVNMEMDFHFLHGRSGRLTAEEAVMTGFSAGELALEEVEITPARREAVARSVQAFGLSTIARRAMAKLSTGERRRVMLARAMVHGPEALILDEPTTGLDLAARPVLLDELARLAQRGTTLLLVTHHVEEILPCFRRVVQLDRGRIVFDGSPDEGLTDERLSQLFGMPLVVARDAAGIRYARPA